MIIGKGKIVLMAVFLCMVLYASISLAELPTMLEISLQQHQQNGLVVGVQPGRLVGSPGDCVYINRGESQGIKYGDQFYVYRTDLKKWEEKVSLPIVGRIEVIDVQPKASIAIVKDFVTPILLKDSVYLIPGGAFELHESVTYFLMPTVSTIDATVVGTPNNKSLLTTGDQVLLNLGKQELEVGDQIFLYRPGTIIQDVATAEILGVSAEVLGVVEILHVETSQSTGVITQFYQFVKIGDRIANHTKIPFYISK